MTHPVGQVLILLALLHVNLSPIDHQVLVSSKAQLSARHGCAYAAVMVWMHQFLGRGTVCVACGEYFDRDE